MRLTVHSFHLDEKNVAGSIVSSKKATAWVEGQHVVRVSGVNPAVPVHIRQAPVVLGICGGGEKPQASSTVRDWWWCSNLSSSESGGGGAGGGGKALTGGPEVLEARQAVAALEHAKPADVEGRVVQRDPDRC